MKKHSLIIMLFAFMLLPGIWGYSQVIFDNERGDRTLRVFGGEMTQEEEEKYLKKFSPEARAKLEEIKKLNKNKYNQLLRSQGFPLISDFYTTAVSLYDSQRGDYASKKFDQQNETAKKQTESEIDVELILLKYKSADETQRQKLRGDLYNALGKLFDVRESFKQEEIKSLEKRLQELKESLNTRKQNRESIVSRRIKELLNEKDELRW
jgi:hypothetical protein